MTLLISALLAPGVQAQRPYQQYWLDRLEELEPGEIIEDNAAPLDPAEERPLSVGDRYQDLDFLTVFPGDASTEQDPVAQLALDKYVRGAVAAETGSPSDSLKYFAEAMQKDPENNWLKLRAAGAALQVNDLSQAEVILEQLLDKDQQNYRALYLMGEMNALRRKYDVAKTFYSRVLEVKPKNINALERLAQIAFEIDRDLSKAKEYAQTILTVDDRNINALLWNAEAAALTGDVEHAADLYERGIRYSPALIPRMSATARQLVLRGLQKDALVLYERAIKISPEDEALRAEWEKALTEQGGESAVRAAYEKLAADSKDVRLSDVYANYLKEKEDWDALKTLREAMLEQHPDHVPALMDMARHHLRDGDLAGAEPYFERAKATNPADPDIYRSIGMAKLEFEEPAEARANLEKALSLNENDVDALDALALLEQHEGDHAKAEELLRKALELKPVDSYLLKRLAALHLAKGERQKAKDLYQQVLVANQFDFDAWLTLAQIYLEDENVTQLNIMEEQARELFKPFPDMQVRYGVLAQSFGDFERSRRALENALKETPEDLAARASLATAYLHLDQVELAIKTIKDAESLIPPEDPRRRAYDQALARVYDEAGQPEKAQELWLALIQKFPDELDLRAALIDSYVKRHQNEKATEQLNAVVREFKIREPIETELLRARTYQASGDTQRAFTTLQRLLQDAPDNGEVWMQYAIAAGELGRHDVAEEYYRKLIALGPPADNEFHISASNNLGYLLAQKGENLDEAEALVKQALASDPTAGYIMDSLGWVYFKKGDLAAARKYLERAAKLSLNDAEVFLHLGELYEKLGEKELARAMYEKALKADPQLKAAQERRDALNKTGESAGVQ